MGFVSKTDLRYHTPHSRFSVWNEGAYTPMTASMMLANWTAFLFSVTRTRETIASGGTRSVFRSERFFGVNRDLFASHVLAPCEFIGAVGGHLLG